ncbi:MAG: hypothetical protein RXQ62_05800 [Nitrososphaeria archaeon]
MVLLTGPPRPPGSPPGTYLEPITRSAPVASAKATISGAREGSCCPSPSMTTKYS